MTQPAEVLIDTDVLIWLARGNANAQRVVAALTDWSISAVSYMELVQGCRNKTELKAMQKAFKSSQSAIQALTPSISEHAIALVENHALSHGLHMADALIAATALEHALPLVTGNAKHFQVVPGLKVIVFKP
jgi:predicted nucleic acid-binding protein